jgi:hypothetical protein
MLPDGRRGRRELWVEDTDHRRHPISANSCSTVPRPHVTVAYWLTTSTSFANPVLAVARSSTNTFSASKVPTELTQSGLKRPSEPGLALARTFGQAT